MARDETKVSPSEHSRVSRLQARLQEAEERNLKLRAELGQYDHTLARLRVDQQNLESLLNNAPNFVVLRGMADDRLVTGEHGASTSRHSTAKWRMVYLGPNFVRLTGLEDVTTLDDCFGSAHPEDLPLLWSAYEEFDQTGSLDARFRSFRPAIDAWQWLHLIARIESNQKDQPEYINGIIIDITDFKNTESQLLVHQKRLQTLNEKRSKAEERERRLLASILHYSIGQKLMSIRQSVGMAVEEGQKLAQFTSHLDSCIAEARSLTTELYPQELRQKGLVSALKSLSAAYGRRFGLKVAFRAMPNLPEAREKLGLVVYRVVAELLTNVVKHAQAHKVEVAVESNGESLLIAVTDDGMGFRASQESKDAERGIGLFSVQERLVRVGGRLNLTQGPEGGTKALIQVRIHPEAEPAPL